MGVGWRSAVERCSAGPSEEGLEGVAEGGEDAAVWGRRPVFDLGVRRCVGTLGNEVMFEGLEEGVDVCSGRKLTVDEDERALEVVSCNGENGAVEGGSIARDGRGFDEGLENGEENVDSTSVFVAFPQTMREPSETTDERREKERLKQVWYQLVKSRFQAHSIVPQDDDCSRYTTAGIKTSTGAT